MNRPKGLDLFSGAGGCSAGYDRAGFDMTGVDHLPQPRYPFRFVQAEALEVLQTWDLSPFAFIHASPPCQLFSTGAPGRQAAGHPDLLTPVRELLRATGKPYVIENVATAPMPGSVLLCGATFGLPLIRHRRFEIYPDLVLVPSTCPQSSFSRGVAHRGRYSYGHGNWGPNWRKYVLPVVWPWMTVAESGQAIPPAYTKLIGDHLMACLEEAA